MMTTKTMLFTNFVNSRMIYVRTVTDVMKFRMMCLFPMSTHCCSTDKRKRETDRQLRRQRAFFKEVEGRAVAS